MKDLESRIYNYGLKTSKFFDSATVSYFLDFNKILGFIPIRLFSEKDFLDMAMKLFLVQYLKTFPLLKKKD